ncbi:Alpha/Beta hydrolase protein [Aspergillus varians]
MPLHVNIDTDRIVRIAVCNLEAVSTGVMAFAGYLSSLILYFTINRIFLAAILIPLYLYKVALSLLPSAIKNSLNLLTPCGWSRLAENAEEYREDSDALAHSQLDGSYRFEADEVFHVKKNSRGWMETAPWANDTHEFNVCGATVRYVHLRASYSRILQDGRRIHRPIVFLHGNPSWSYMWRNVFHPLLERGHDVYAIDWLGHGRSDKILCPEAITFELHIRTLVRFFEVTELQDAIIAAHDWGGCIALCTTPRLPPNTCTSLFLLNTFFPPRASDASLHSRLLNRIWYCITGLLHGFLPTSAALRFLAPSLTNEDIKAYTAPYSGLPRSSKSSIERFAHIAPSLPRSILFTLRQTFLWKVFEGLTGPSHFETLTTQSRLAAQDDQVRRYWGSTQDEADSSMEVVVVFGDGDPLRRDCRAVLLREIHPERMVKWAAKGLWITGAGHVPVEGKAGQVAGLIARFARGERGWR